MLTDVFYLMLLFFSPIQVVRARERIEFELDQKIFPDLITDAASDTKSDAASTSSPDSKSDTPNSKES